MHLLSDSEKVRYSRHLNLPQFGSEGQLKLKRAKVLVIGAGGLGCPLLQYLTAAGVGTIGVMDDDLVDISNLHRQVLYDTNDIGKEKTTVAIQKLKRLNPNVHFIGHQTKLDSSKAIDILMDYDIIADATDNFPSRYLICDACVFTGKPHIYASVHQFEGQLSVFNLPEGSSNGPNYRDLYPQPPPPGMIPDCAEGGVLGVLPGIIGAMQASEVIKVITGAGNLLAGRLFIFDALEFTTRIINFEKNPTNPVTGDDKSILSLIDYDAFCGVIQLNSNIPQIDIHSFYNLRLKKGKYFLVDVREPFEYDTSNLGGISAPLKDILNFKEQIPTEGKVIVCCATGRRSEKAIQILQSHGYSNLYNLKGGLKAWKEQYDPEMMLV